jgi:hypothetical protein
MLPQWEICYRVSKVGSSEILVGPIELERDDGTFLRDLEIRLPFCYIVVEPLHLAGYAIHTETAYRSIQQ